MVSVHCFFFFFLMAAGHFKQFLKFELHLPWLFSDFFSPNILNVFSGKQEALTWWSVLALCNVRLTLPRQYCTLEDLCWCISDYMGHSLLSYIEWSRLLHASPVSCASTYPCRAKIQSEIPHRALSSCLHPFWQNLHFSLAICGLCYMSPFQASLP